MTMDLQPLGRIEIHASIDLVKGDRRSAAREGLCVEITHRL